MREAEYGLVGRGRVATHLAQYLMPEGLGVRQWHRGSPEPQEDALSSSDAILLAINDDQIQSFIEEHPALSEKQLVHFSGCLAIPGATGLHPLMTFSSDLYSLSVYQSIPFISEKGAQSFAQTFPTLKNPEFTIPAKQKPLYHALCVISGNFPMLLRKRVLERLQSECGVPKPGVQPYLFKCLKNSLAATNHGPTGPMSRGDLQTASRNLSALGDGVCSRIYSAFAREFAGISI